MSGFGLSLQGFDSLGFEVCPVEDAKVVPKSIREISHARTFGESATLTSPRGGFLCEVSLRL